MDPVRLVGLGLPLVGSFSVPVARAAAAASAAVARAVSSAAGSLAAPAAPAVAAAAMPAATAAVAAAYAAGAAAVRTSATTAATCGEATAAVAAPVQMGPEAAALAESMRRPMPSLDPARHVSVVSWNMLLKGFEHKPYYPGVPPAFRAWAWRREQVKDVLLGLSADIFCMQEVEAATFEAEFGDLLSEAGYGWVEPKDDSKGKFPEMAKCAIFYKADRFEKVWQEHRSRVVLAAFRHRPSGRPVYVASGHLEGAPWQVVARFTQARKALDSIKRQMAKDKVVPVSCAFIFAGDFNETEDSAVCHCLREGGLARGYRAPGLPDEELTSSDYAHAFDLADLYGTASNRPPTFCAPAEESAAWGSSPTFAAVDFVFYSRGALRPVAVRRAFTEAQRRATEGVGIPAEWHPSDHVPIGGVFEFIGDNGAGESPGPSAQAARAC
mmetsp:Transcript_112929/g.319506  ORF Transcript_112929/g.319506 Transcript_112929/m.319506 type:complete len:440 (-) Transcript_112929:26-1345(-)